MFNYSLKHKRENVHSTYSTTGIVLVFLNLNNDFFLFSSSNFAFMIIFISFLNSNISYNSSLIVHHCLICLRSHTISFKFCSLEILNEANPNVCVCVCKREETISKRHNFNIFIAFFNKPPPNLHLKLICK